MKPKTLLAGLALALDAQTASSAPVGANRAQAGQPEAMAIARQWSAAWNAHNAAALARLYAADAIYEDMAFQARFQGRAAIGNWVAITHDAIPDARIAVTEAFGTGDRVTIRWRFRGTPTKLGPVPGTGRSFDVPAVTILDIRNGMIVRDQDFYNLADLQRQIGVAAGAFTPMAGRAGEAK